MQRVVTKVGLGRHVVNQFQQEVNKWLEEGYHLDVFEVEKKGWLRIFCVAVLCDDEECEGSYDGEGGDEEPYEDYEETYTKK